ncbi:hypothetical protein D3C85_1491380 [compost metagenome]
MDIFEAQHPDGEITIIATCQPRDKAPSPQQCSDTNEGIGTLPTGIAHKEIAHTNRSNRLAGLLDAIHPGADTGNHQVRPVRLHRTAQASREMLRVPRVIVIQNGQVIVWPALRYVVDASVPSVCHAGRTLVL